MRPYLVALSLLCAAPLHAQYLQEQYTADFSLRTFVTQQSATQFHYEIQFRNESTYDPMRVFGITNVIVTGLLPNSASVNRVRKSGFVGEVYHGVLSSAPAGHNLTPLNQFGTDASNDPTMLFLGTDGGFFLNGYGMLGCSIPNRSTGGQSNYYDSSTCAAGGFTGWRFASLDFTFAVPTSFTAADIFVRMITVEDRSAAYDVAAVVTVPEPATLGMLTVGLLLLSAVRCTRRSVR
ncbi:MAG: PEP-CTERM sorting domain-containing protein [Gemmatimonas sp.]